MDFCRVATALCLCP
ncbi:hypothetical protein [Nocardiopsis dassonvillei]